jgi:hypothetical protein
MTMRASASSLDSVNGRRQRMWASGDVPLARNDGSDPVELNAIFLARTGTKEFLAPVTQPKGCTV